MEGIGSINPASLGEYQAGGGYAGLDAALSLTPDAVIRPVLDAGLQGRGGAYFPAARKWQAARRVDAVRHHLVVNAAEGEPGVFKDRHLMEGNPHRTIEGVVIAAYAAGAGNVVIYINAEADLSAERMAAAVAEAEQGGIISNSTVTVRRRAGGYVCGEETTLLNIIERRRREPRLRPPFPTDAGRYGEPTVINNAGDAVQCAGDSDRRRAAVCVYWFASIGLNDAKGNAAGFAERRGAASGAAVAARLAEYNAAESCGKCTPCREGTPRVAAAAGAGGCRRGEDVRYSGLARFGGDCGGGVVVRVGADGRESGDQLAAFLWRGAFTGLDGILQRLRKEGKNRAHSRAPQPGEKQGAPAREERSARPNLAGPASLA